VRRGLVLARTDRFGNPIEGELPYARGKILRSTEDDYRKVTKAWRIIERRMKEKGNDGVFNFSGLERTFPAEADDLEGLDDETAPALYMEAFKKLALQHLGGSPDVHDVFLANRMTAATMAVHMALVKPRETVIGVSPSHSHSTIIRAVNHMGARFVDTVGVEGFSKALENVKNVSLVALTRLAVTYDILDVDELKKVVALAKERGLTVYLDDAGGARVGPAIFKQPKSLELGVDVAATGLDKYGTYGPRFGLVGGRKELVSKIRSRAWEFGLEARPIFTVAALKSLERYDPKRVEASVLATKQIGSELKKLLGAYVHETAVTAQLLGEDILELAMKRAEVKNPPVVPYEAAAALAMLLLQDYGIITVHFAAVPPGTSAILFKFIPPEVLEKFGGAKRFAEAVDSSITKLAMLLTNPNSLQSLLLEA